MARGEWVDLTPSMVGDVPLSRYMHGFIALNGYLFLFGGFYSGGIHSILGEAEPA